MQLKDYIQGDRRGKDANRLEREAMSDPFLQDALEGFEAVAGNHAQIIDRLERKFTQPAIAPHRGRRLFLAWSTAASVLLLVGFSAYFFLVRTENTIPEIAMLQPDVNEGLEEAIVDDSPVSQPAPMEESQKEIAIAKEMPSKATSISSKSMSKLSTSHVVESEEVTDVLIVADEIVADANAVEEIVAQEIVVEKRASENLVASPAKAMARSEQSRQTVSGKVVEERDLAPPATFGEKEFQKYCQENAGKNICDGQGATVKLSFFIDETGKPTKIEYQRYSCEEAKKEMENLLSSSPVWTKTNRKVSMTVKW